ncbi:hypothetical protein V474_14365 [Novosphingobium barchaimii LL02]|uniref:Peptidase M4 n=1 Tax=Novosphingobium barchaimii LL02 TaxID=1114963 RepID=A0A0J7XXZ9_9SPHN|nr:hypothetical protein [Novosphingobium barchaimii]KMS56158.1 hypothetical protein V474_14365 [Novosphingobium barchaimii LL02]
MNTPAGQVGGKVTVSARVLHEVRSPRPACSSSQAPARPSADPRDYPIMRAVRVYAADTSIRSQRGGIVTIALPFEPLTVTAAPAAAVRGERFAIVLPHGDAWIKLQGMFDMKPDSAAILADSGYAPSLSDPRFIVQMVYAVASDLYITFRRALGREIALGLRPVDTSEDGTELWERSGCFELHPWAMEEAQAWYDRKEARISFGYYKAKQDAVGYAPGSRVFTALSHDVIVHEMTHALLDAVKPHFVTPTNRDVLAFHEAFADLIAIFQRFRYADLVAEQIRNARANIDALDILNSLARTFAKTSGLGNTLRPLSGDLMYDTVGEEPHDLGNVLVQAVYQAFRVVANRRIDRLVDIATNGTGILPPGALSPSLADEIAHRVSKTARIFQTMLIRALDYCPPFDISFFTFLRAVISADIRLVPVDGDGIRDAWMEAFRYHRIFPTDGLHYAEEQIAWDRIAEDMKLRIPALSFSQIAFAGNPGDLLPMETAVTQASEVAATINQSPQWRAHLGLETAPDSGTHITTEILGIRSFARPGPNGMTEFGTVVEIVSRTFGGRDRSGFMSSQGACLIFESEGKLSSCAPLSPNREARRQDIEQYSVSAQGARSWSRDSGNVWKLGSDIFAGLCIR